MPKRSSVSRLPDEIRQKISHLRDQGRTLDEIMNALEALDVDVSRSSLGRYVKKQAQVADQIRRSRELSEAIGRQFGDDKTSRVARTNIELLHTLMMKLMIGGEDETEVVLDAKDAMFAATALEKLSKASKLDVEERLKVKEEARKEAMTAAAEIVDKTGKEKGLSAETIQELKSKFLGVPHV